MSFDGEKIRIPVEATTAAFPKNSTKVPTELIAATLKILLKMKNCNTAGQKI